MIITVKSNTYNNNINVNGRGCNASITINNTTPYIIQKIRSGGATGPEGLGADPIFIQQTEQRLAELESDPKHEWNAIQW